LSLQEAVAGELHSATCLVVYFSYLADTCHCQSVYAKFELPSFTHSKDMKGLKIYNMRWLGTTQGHCHCSVDHILLPVSILL